jgi:hypothetical protein
MSTGARYPSLWDRLVAHVRIELECWLWIGPTRRHGGGHRPAVSMRVADRPNPKNFNAARVMCELIHGPAPSPEHEASHLCEDEWLCINPDHLIWETKKENMARQWARWRREHTDPDIEAGTKCDSNEIPF